MVRPVRVAAVPSAHPYVRHLLPLPGEPQMVRHLPDPPVAGRPPDQWWPPAVLDPAWVAAHREEVDVVHVHFGTESLPPGRLAASLAALRDAGLPLVHTVHDLTNPQLQDQTGHELELGLLLGAADRVLTLTPGAAAVVLERWGRIATVVPHPHVVALDAAPLRTSLGAADPLTVGVHLRDLRPNIDGPGTTRLLVSAVEALCHEGVDARAVVHLDLRVRDEAAAVQVETLVAGSSSAALRRASRLDDDALNRSLAGLDVSLAPYRFGTHSGWVELCWDLAVPVVSASGIGFYAQQHPEPGALLEYAAGDPADLARVLASLAERRDERRAGREQEQRERRLTRVAQRREIARAHRETYAAALG